MFSTLVFIFVVFLLQEGALMGATIVFALHQGVSPWTINGLFFLALAIDIWIGLLAGRLLRQEFAAGSRFKHWLERKTGPVRVAGAWMLMAISIADFPYINSAVGSWLGLSKRLVVTFTAVGDTIYYALLWLVVFGILELSPNTYVAMALALAFIFILTLLARKYIKRRHGR